MADSTIQPSPEEELLAAFTLELEKRGRDNTDEIIREFVNRYPQMSALSVRLRQFADEIPDFGASRAEPTAPRLLGEFEIRRQMDHGGMGRIYEAWHDRLQRRVVIKTIRRNAGLRDVRRRFEQEQRVLARLHQTNIIPIYTAGEEDEIQYYAMPYVDGANLGSVVGAIRESRSNTPGRKTPSLAEIVKLVKERDQQQETKVSDPTAEYESVEGSASPTNNNGVSARGEQCSISSQGQTTSATHLREIELSVNGSRLVLSDQYYRSVATVIANSASAVHQVHEAGYLHRDIKPSNVMVEQSGHSWVIDFGLARRLDGEDASGDTDDGVEAPLTRHGQLPGTPQYMAPEQWDESQLDPRTDVWALGVTLYELLALQPAFSMDGLPDGHKYERLKQTIMHDSPVPVRDLANVPRDLAAICRRPCSGTKNIAMSTRTHLPRICIAG